MDLEKELPAGVIYQPADIVSRDNRTILCDLNAGKLPDVPADVVALLGVIEYCHAPAVIFAALASRWGRLVMSYNPADLDNGRDRRAHGWFNDLTSAQLTGLAGEAGYRLTAMVAHGERERIYSFSMPNNERGGGGV